MILDVCITDLHLCKCRCSVCSAAQCIDGFSVHCCIAEIYECGDRAKNIHVVLTLLLSYCYLYRYFTHLARAPILIVSLVAI